MNVAEDTIRAQCSLARSAESNFVFGAKKSILFSVLTRDNECESGMRSRVGVGGTVGQASDPRNVFRANAKY